MAYNLMCESSEKICWEEINTLASRLMQVEILPMPTLGTNGGDAFGICIPLKKTGEKAWREMELLLTTLLQDLSFCVYEMYSSKRITLNNLHELKSQIVY